jgi:hypothetical protein
VVTFLLTSPKSVVFFVVISNLWKVLGFLQTDKTEEYITDKTEQCHDPIRPVLSWGAPQSFMRPAALY